MIMAQCRTISCTRTGGNICQPTPVACGFRSKTMPSLALCQRHSLRLAPKNCPKRQPIAHGRTRVLTRASNEERCGRITGVGSAVVDYLALVASYPKPDQKLRTEELEVQGGGNCGNALTAAAKLGLKPTIFSKIGDDGVGSQILSELENAGVDTSQIIIAKGSPSPFTYIIVDRLGGTRTCIHTPAEPLHPEEVSENILENLLNGIELIYFDGRLTEAALVIAKAAREKGIKVLVEAERLRPNLEKLLGFADYVVTSAHFPQDWTGEELLGDALLSTFLRLPNTKLMITTLGSKGSVVIKETTDNSNQNVQEAVLEDLLDQMWVDLEKSKSVISTEQPACISKNGVEIGCSRSIQSGDVVLRHKRSEQEKLMAGVRARSAAQEEAAANAQSGDGQSFEMNSEMSSQTVELKANVWVSSTAKIAKEAVLDTTGAGDAFIGGTLYGLVNNFEIEDIVKLASVVAACKCTALGARTGLPNRSDIRTDLLQ